MKLSTDLHSSCFTKYFVNWLYSVKDMWCHSKYTVHCVEWKVLPLILYLKGNSQLFSVTSHGTVQMIIKNLKVEYHSIR